MGETNDTNTVEDRSVEPIRIRTAADILAIRPLEVAWLADNVGRPAWVNKGETRKDMKRGRTVSRGDVMQIAAIGGQNYLDAMKREVASKNERQTPQEESEDDKCSVAKAPDADAVAAVLLQVLSELKQIKGVMCELLRKKVVQPTLPGM